jgi:hypothetical protein
MTPIDFKNWRTRLAMTQVQAAAELHVTARSIKRYEEGSRGISDQIEMLTRNVERRLLKRGGIKYVSSGGNNRIQTPRALAAALIAKLNITGLSLDPCRGGGAFYDALPEPKLWCEIDEGRDFLAFHKSVDWIVTNPPWAGAELRPILNHAFALAADVALLLPLTAALGMRSRNKTAKGHAHGPVRIITFETPPEFPATGFQLCMCHWSRSFNGSTAWDTL